MRRNTTPLALRSVEEPRIELDITLDKIPLALSDEQYRGIVAWSKEFSRHDKARHYRRWRPTSTVKEKSVRFASLPLFVCIIPQSHFACDHQKGVFAKWLLTSW